jgi:hypothetical protein
MNDLFINIIFYVNFKYSMKNQLLFGIYFKDTFHYFCD